MKSKVISTWYQELAADIYDTWENDKEEFFDLLVGFFFLFVLVCAALTGIVFLTIKFPMVMIPILLLIVIFLIFIIVTVRVGKKVR